MIRWFCVVTCWFVGFLPAAEPLQTFAGCKLVAEEWSDGDSFPVLFPDGKTITVRLYGVDCMEMHVQGNESNARRLRDQRRYFGIADITTAREVGVEAKKETTRLLAKPFTVVTAFADGRGDGRYQRIYGFVTLPNGTDLSETLVRKGLARAYGVVRQRADGTSGEDWKEALADLELTAAKAGLGAWRHTDWAKLPDERREAREEMAELAAAKNAGNEPPSKPLDVNSAPRDQLMTISGIGEKTANEIISARPYRTLDDLLRVPGIGPATLRKIRPFLTIGAP